MELKIPILLYFGKRGNRYNVLYFTKMRFNRRQMTGELEGCQVEIMTVISVDDSCTGIDSTKLSN